MMPPRILIVFACMACWLSASVAGADTTIIGGATRVIDADTLEVIGERVRLKGIDAPEKGQLCENASGNLYLCGQAALRALRGHIGDSKTVCGIGPQPDRYGRALGVCYLKGEDLNGWLVSQGHALAYRRYGTQYVEQEEAARPAKRGVWAGAFVAPWEWRAGERLHVTSATEACPGRTSSASWPCMTTTATAGLRAGRRGATALRRCRAVIQLIRTCTTGMVTAWSVNSLIKRRPAGRTDCLWPPAVLPAHAICTHMVG